MYKLNCIDVLEISLFRLKLLAHNSLFPTLKDIDFAYGLLLLVCF